MQIPDEIANQHIAKSYIICTTGRSGSNLLCRSLKNLGYLSNPLEYFHPQKLQRWDKTDEAEKVFKQYNQVIAEKTDGRGTFGIKLHWHHFRHVLRSMRKKFSEFSDKSDFEIIKVLFPHPYFIYLWRRDTLKQAISTELAFQSNVWIKKDGETTPAIASKLRFKPLNIYRYKQGLDQCNQKWRRFFERNSIKFYEIVYEDFVNSFERVIAETVDFLDFEFDETTTIQLPTQKQSNTINEKWYRYYRYIPEALLAQYSALRTQIRQSMFSR